TSYEQVLTAPVMLGRLGLVGKSNPVRVLTGSPTAVPATPPGSLIAAGLQGFYLGGPPAIIPALRISDTSSLEGNVGTTQAVFVVTLINGTLPCQVDYATADQTAVAGQDYVSTNGTLMFAPGESSKTIQVTLIGDTTVESNETFTVNLSNPVNAVLLGGSAV